MVKFMVDSFGSGRDMSKEQAVAALHIPQEGEEVEEEEVESAAPGSTPQQADVCSLADSKPAYPVDSDSLSTTGVPRELFSDNMPSGPSRQSTYYCLFGEPCSALTHQKASIAAHLRRKHLGISIACKYWRLPVVDVQPFREAYAEETSGDSESRLVDPDRQGCRGGERGRGSRCSYGNGCPKVGSSTCIKLYFLTFVFS